MTSRRSFLRTAAGLTALTPLEVFGQNRQPAPPTGAHACIVIDAVTGQPLFEKGADERRPVASTQKLLAALVAVESTSMDKTTTVAVSDTRVEPTKMYLKAGDRYQLRTLLHAMLIESSNDCAACMARSCAGSVAQFAVWMNRRAAQLGARSSRFLNPHGLPAEGQYSTARDMSRIARAALYNPAIRGIVSQAEHTISRADGRVKKLETTNYLLRRNSSFYTPICTGMKTGYTSAAGKCLISSASIRGRAVICVMLGSNKKIIWKESRAMLYWALGLSAP